MITWFDNAVLYPSGITEDDIFRIAHRPDVRDVYPVQNRIADILENYTRDILADVQDGDVIQFWLDDVIRYGLRIFPEFEAELYDIIGDALPEDLSWYTSLLFDGTIVIVNSNKLVFGMF